MVGLPRETARIFDQRFDYGGSVFSIQLNEHYIPRLPLYQSRNLALTIAKQQVAFPVARDRSILD